MDHSQVATQRIRDDEFAADKARFASFRLGAGLPNSHSSLPSSRPSHSRSHSRNNSVSASPSLSFSVSSTSTNDMSLLSSSSSSQSIPSNNLSGSKRPNSHHRRRSSVSTRRESAEIMGVSLPELPPSHSEDNINLGDKDSIRRRALWALEGKSDSGSFSRVEIPELNTPELERRISDFPSKPSFPPGFGGNFGSGLNSLAGKRDSFGKHLPTSSSTKDQLHTLVEEEEEEEEEEHEEVTSPIALEASPHNETPVSTAGRHRPVGLNLRPLSLLPETLGSAVNGDLPTPDYTPSIKSSGLRELTLASSPNLSSLVASNDASFTAPSTLASRRQSLILPTNVIPSQALFRRSSLNLRTDSLSSVSSDGFESKKRSSISYKPAAYGTSSQVVAGLPTPDLTPTSERRTSTSSSDSDWSGGRPFSTSEQYFLHKSHATLLARITDLERALSTRPISRPVSQSSDATMHSELSAPAEPSDEMLQLIADLKAERDELKRDVDGWRNRVADLEKQAGNLARRVDQERREAWVARERVGLLEVEKRALIKLAEDKAFFAEEMHNKCQALQQECAQVTEDYEKVREELARGKAAEEECIRLRAALAAETQRREELERELEGAGLLATPTPAAFPIKPVSAVINRRRGLGLRSIDSEGSYTEVGSIDSMNSKTGFDLNAVTEEEEYSDDDGLAGYEDEQDSDVSFGSPSCSSSASMDDLPRSISHLEIDIPVNAPMSVSATPSPQSPSSPTHVRENSLSRAWSFPAKGSAPISAPRRVEEVDRFFGCLEDLEDSPPIPSTENPFSRKFSFGDDEDDDALPPFVLPADVGIEVEDSPKMLAIVEEEEEPEEDSFSEPDDEFVGEVDDGGIKFTFSLPADFEVSEPEPVRPSSPRSPLHRKPVPFYEPLSEDEEPFSFSQSSTPVSIPPTTPTSCSPVSRRSGDRSVSPSSIPRATSLKRFEMPTKIPAPRFTPVATTSSFTTPSTTRGASRPSFIPQPSAKVVASPSSPYTSPKPTPPMFLPQPQRKSSSPSSQASTANRIKLGQSDCVRAGVTANGSTPFQPKSSPSHTLKPTSRSFDVVALESEPLLNEEALQHDDDNTDTTMTSPSMAARLAFQSFTNMIPNPFSWSPRLGSPSGTGTVAATAAALCMIPESQSSSTIMSGDSFEDGFGRRSSEVKEVKRGYVPKERQLEKLRLRMRSESGEQLGPSTEMSCKRCREGVIRF